MRKKLLKRNLRDTYKIGLHDGQQFADNIPEEHRIEIMVLVDGEPIEPGQYLSDLMESFTQYSEWSSFYLPTFRQLAGYKDTLNVGTFTDGGEEENWNFGEIIDQYDTGQMDGFLIGLIKRLRNES